MKSITAMTQLTRSHADERIKLEKQVFQRELESIWQDTVKFFTERDPAQIERANE